MRFISFLLAVLIIFTAVPMQVFAAEGEDDDILWEQGTIASADGTNNSTTTRFRTAGYLKLKSYSGVSINSGYTMTNFVYDAEYNYLGTSSWIGDGIPFTTAELSEKYPSGIYFRVVFRAIDQRKLTEEDITASGVKIHPAGEEVPVPDFGFTYEDLGNIGVWQDGDIHDGKIFVFGAAGAGAVFDLETLEKLGGITLDEKDVIKPHANSVCFGSTYYEPGDKYPLLYINIYNNYASAEDRMEGTCCVYRLLETEGSFRTELVQVIKIGFTEDLTLWKSKENNGDVRPYGNFVVDTDENRLYAFVMRDANKTTRFFEFDIPKLSEGIYNETYGCNVVTLETADIKSQFDSEYYNYLQGCCYYGGKILYMGDFGGDAPLYLVNLEEQRVTDNYCLGYAGLRAEPEVICVDDSDGTFYYCAADGILRKIVLAAEFEKPCGESAFWSLENGVLRISGSGEMEDYPNAKSVPWYENRGEITSVVIEEGITSAGAFCFADCPNLEEVSLPESLEKIGKYSFWGCGALSEIVLPENLLKIGAGAFFRCSALEYIAIPSGVTVLEQAVFGQCENLETVALHDGITAIEKEAFSRCYALRHFSLPQGLASIGYHAFFGCAQLEQLTFPEGFEKLGEAPFYGCANLGTLRFMGNLPELPENAFLDITAKVFYSMHDESWNSAVGKSFGGTITWTAECFHEYNMEITEPTCVLEGYSTFTCALCGDSYTDMYIPATGHSFGEWYTTKDATFTEDGEECRECTKCSHVEFRFVPLTVITSGNFGYGTEPTDKVIYTIYSNGTMVVDGEGILFDCGWNGKKQPFIEYRKQVKHLIIGEGITSTTSGSFAYFSNLETVSFPSTLTKLPNNAFMSAFKESVTNITIPETVEQIGAYALGHYGGDPSACFTEVIIENPDINITDHKAVFNGGSKLDKLTLYSYGTENNVSAYAKKYGIRYIDLNTYKTGEFSGIEYEYYEGVLTLSTDFEGVLIPAENAPWHEHRNEIQKIVIGEGITGISENAFVNYPVLEEVAIPDNLKSIGNGAFAVTEGEFVPLEMKIPRYIEFLGKDIFKGRKNVDLTVYYGSLAEKIDEPGVNLTVKKVFKILFIGNSYTEDATCCGQKMPDSQVFNAMQAMLGEDAEVTLGVIVSGGKGINWHATQAEQGKKCYTLRTMSSEDKTWKSHGTVTSMDALAFTDWDAVSLQHYGLNVEKGEESISYPEQTDEKFYKLEAASEYMLDLFAEYAPHAKAYFYYHWAQTSSMTMNAALSTYNKRSEYIPVVLDYSGTKTGKQFENIVPVGLSVQNARTTYLALLRYNTTAYADGNLNLVTDAQIGLQRDGGHLSFNIGRYIAGLTFAEMVIPEEMREEGYVLPDIRITESIGKLPKEYTEIAQKSVFAAVESWKNGSLAVTEIEGYKVDPVDTESAKLAETKIEIPFAADADSLKERISEAVLKILPSDFAVESVEFAEGFEVPGAGQEFEAEVRIRFGYMSKTVSVPVKITKALIGDINLDGAVNVKDAYYARLVAAKLIKPTDEQITLGDVDCDGKITAIDANIIRKFVVKIITTIPVEM